jgi:gentisate 1,2-dioxygenase
MNVLASVAQPTDERQRLSSDLERLDIVGFWKIRPQFEKLEPVPPEKPGIWHYEQYGELSYRAARVIPVEEADRRNIMFSNPGLPGTGFITKNFFAGVQSINPGEVAPVHRHTGSATRLYLEGKGGYTTVENDKCMLERGDVVLNPNGAWHENGNDGNETIIWLDVLDIPLTYRLNANFFDNGYTELDAQGKAVPKQFQTVTRRDDWSAHAYAAGGVRPAYVSHRSGMGYGSPQLMYKYEPTRALLEDLRKEEGSPWDGLIVEYYSPENGGPVMKTMDAHMIMLRGGEVTHDHRQTNGQVFCCLEGSGVTVVGTERLEWKKNDIFVVPSWAWHHHENKGSEDAILYCASDAPLLKHVGLYVEERKGKDGKVERIQV